jgi:hypothetical protein
MPSASRLEKTPVAAVTGLLSIWLRLHPELWDWVVPYGPPVSLDRSSAVALNPQPLTPRLRFATAIQQGAMQIADAAVSAAAAGGDVRRLFDDAGDELCPRPPHPPLPWPRAFPVPVPPGEPYPIDLETVTPVVQAQVAIVFQSYADRIADDTLRGHFAALADRCADAALEQAVA